MSFLLGGINDGFSIRKISVNSGYDMALKDVFFAIRARIIIWGSSFGESFFPTFGLKNCLIEPAFDSY